LQQLKNTLSHLLIGPYKCSWWEITSLNFGVMTFTFGAGYVTPSEHSLLLINLWKLNNLNISKLYVILGLTIYYHYSWKLYSKYIQAYKIKPTIYSWNSVMVCYWRSIWSMNQPEPTHLSHPVDEMLSLFNF